MAGKNAFLAGFLTFFFVPAGAIYTWGCGGGFFVTLAVFVVYFILPSRSENLWYALVVNAIVGLIAFFAVWNAQTAVRERRERLQ